MNRVNTCFYRFRCKSTALVCKDIALEAKKCNLFSFFSNFSDSVWNI